MSSKDYEASVTAAAAKQLVGRKIIGARYMDQSEAEHLGWDERSFVLILDDKTCIFASQDDEGNGPGALFTTLEGTLETIAVVP